MYMHSINLSVANSNVIAGNFLARKRNPPRRHQDYIDFSYRTEYLEQDFLEFEDYVIRTHSPNYSSKLNPHANSEYIMNEFEKYERFVKRESLELFRSRRKAKKSKGMVNMKYFVCICLKIFSIIYHQYILLFKYECNEEYMCFKNLTINRIIIGS